MLSLSDAGLLAFISAVALDVAGLLLDGVLLAAGVQTITARVGRHPVLGLPILGLNAAGFVGLALHFYWRLVGAGP